MTKDLIKLLEKHEAILSGYFELSSGLLSTQYIQCAKLQEKPRILKIFTDLLTKKIKDKYKSLDDLDSIIGPAIGGIIPAYQLAESFDNENIKAIFAEKTSNVSEKKFEFKRGFKIIAGKYYIVMEDVVTTGGSMYKVIDLVESLGGKILCACSIIDRTNGGSKSFRHDFISLLDLEIKTFDRNNIPEELKDEKFIKMSSINQVSIKQI